MLCLDNIIFSLQKNGGISVYWAELLRGLLQAGFPLRVVERADALYNHKRQEFELPGGTVYPERSLPLPLFRYLPVASLPAGSKIWHSSYYRPCLPHGVKQLFTVYDFIYERYTTGVRRLAHTRQQKMAIRNAERIICISHSTAHDLLQYYPETPPERLHVIHLGCSDAYHPLADPGRDEWGQQDGGRFVLFVGERKGYKNFSAAVRAVGLLEEMRLVAVGGGIISSRERQLLDRHLPGRFMHYGYLAEERLNQLYNQAWCLLYTSEYEGFGLPPLEAMQAGCPVVTVRSSSMPEICGKAALFAADVSPEAFAAEMLLLKDNSVRQKLREAGLVQAGCFSWQENCRKTMELYRELLQG